MLSGYMKPSLLSVVLSTSICTSYECASPCIVRHGDELEHKGL